MGEETIGIGQGVPHRLRSLGALGRALLVLATIILAMSLPLRYYMALKFPSRAVEFGFQWLPDCPTGTRAIVTIAIIIETVLKILIVWDIWKVIGHFTRGEFISRAVSAIMRRISVMLIGISITGTVGLAVGLASLWVLGRDMPSWILIGPLLNVPSGAFVCAILGFAAAAAFEHASRMADEARFTV